MITFFNGESRLQCDGCFEFIDKGSIHHIERVAGGEGTGLPFVRLHFHRLACESRYQAPMTVRRGEAG